MNFYGFFTKDHISNKNEKRDWKEKNKRYLNQLQRFFRCHRSHSRRRVKKSYYCTNVEM